VIDQFDALYAAAIRYLRRKPPAHTKLALGLAQQQQTRIRGLAPPSKSTVSFLRWTAGRSKGSGLSSVMAAVALSSCTMQFV
jgi:hypothetical protein